MACARGVGRQRSAARMILAGMALGCASLGWGSLLACSGATGEPMNSTSGGPVEVPPWACVPGETQPCPCPDGLEGLLTCDPQGAGFGECDCSPGAVSQGPPPTSGGTETDTGSGTAGSSDTASEATSGSTSPPDPTTSSGSSSGPGSSSGGPGTTSGTSTSL